MAKTPTIPKGTRDFSPSEMRKRNYVFQIIKQSFEKYGFEQIETPSMENMETLTGKYGEEGDRLIFKILNRGDKLTKALNQENTSQKELAAENVNSKKTFLKAESDFKITQAHFESLKKKLELMNIQPSSISPENKWTG